MALALMTQPNLRTCVCLRTQVYCRYYSNREYGATVYKTGQASRRFRHTTAEQLPSWCIGAILLVDSCYCFLWREDMKRRAIVMEISTLKSYTLSKGGKNGLVKGSTVQSFINNRNRMQLVGASPVNTHNRHISSEEARHRKTYLPGTG